MGRLVQPATPPLLVPRHPARGVRARLLRCQQPFPGNRRGRTPDSPLNPGRFNSPNSRSPVTLLPPLPLVYRTCSVPDGDSRGTDPDQASMSAGADRPRRQAVSVGTADARRGVPDSKDTPPHRAAQAHGRVVARARRSFWPREHANGPRAVAGGSHLAARKGSSSKRPRPDQGWPDADVPGQRRTLTTTAPTPRATDPPRLPATSPQHLADALNSLLSMPSTVANLP